ncbi:hypothetical protein BJD60_gp44 [Gordonia phage Schnabeltier]|uniref:Uncharacterized protein n=1 Tax=Gordonia phage Schnabeltier TaxID=1821561 RepID=A0A142KA32_9CAUD|nr:hypothetical protein BJD60_gp44 [Gordonia phage Schnabeltier]AMS02965.1 hypothetical protein SEA_SCHNABELTIER_44 [Gordonia phage Schnabeltier]
MMGEEAAGGTNPHGAGGRGVAVVKSPISQPLPDLDTIDLVSVCDIDADAIIAWRRTVHGPSLAETFSNVARTWRRILANWHPPR